MSKTYKAEDIIKSEKQKRQINARTTIYEVLETLMKIKYPLKEFNLTEAIEELIIDAARARGLISMEREDLTPEEIYAKCVTLLQENQKFTGSFFDTAQSFLSEIQTYLNVPVTTNNKALHVNKATSL